MLYSLFMTIRVGGGLSTPNRRDTMKRRQFVEQLGIGSAVLAAAASVAHAAQGEHQHTELTGAVAHAPHSLGSGRGRFRAVAGRNCASAARSIHLTERAAGGKRARASAE